LQRHRWALWREVLVGALGSLAVVGGAGGLQAAKPAPAPKAAPPRVTVVVNEAPAPAPAPASRCVDDGAAEVAAAEGREGPTGTTAATTREAPVATPTETPRETLAALVREALARSQALGATRLLADATQDDVKETLAGKDVQASLSGSLGPQGNKQSGGIEQQQSAVLRTNLNVSQTIYDFGRLNALADWRKELAESARLGVMSQQEQLAAATVSLALERSRYRQQGLVYGQFARKMGCLVQALETIVGADRGRASELLQARKSLQQAELSQVQALASVRQVETRLRRLVGDGLPSAAGLSTVLLATPPMDQLLDELARAPDIAQLGSQVNAAEKLARAQSLAGKPQIGWQFSGGGSYGTAPRSGGPQPVPEGPQKQANYSVQLTINVPLFPTAVGPARDAAQKRAQASALQLQEALDTRRNRLTELYDQTAATFDRARRLSAVLRDSEQVRNYTLQQWQQLGRRSLFDVMGAESEHYNLRVSYINALHDGQQLNANLLSMGLGVAEWLK
jgi:outer membrane protein TolC